MSNFKVNLACVHFVHPQFDGQYRSLNNGSLSTNPLAEAVVLMLMINLFAGGLWNDCAKYFPNHQWSHPAAFFV